MNLRKKICIIAFSPISRDARVLRQIKYLSPRYDLVVIGYGAVPAEWQNQDHIVWKSLDSDFPETRSLTLSARLLKWLRLWRQDKQYVLDRLLAKYVARFLYLGRLFPAIFDKWYWSSLVFTRAFQMAVSSSCDALLANDWTALPLAAEAANILCARLVFDAHEYAPAEYNHLSWRMNFAPLITYLLRKYSAHIDASLTVTPLIAERYRKEFHWSPVVVRNIPEATPICPHDTVPEAIHLVHHGGAFRLRQLENMIETIHLADVRYHLHFLLVGGDANYLQYLRDCGERLAPGRIHFHDAVPPERIVQRISEYDMGFCYIPPVNYNYLVSLPNKFFDCIVAGLAVCIGPSPEMAAIVHQYGLGCVAPSFEPRQIATMLNRLSLDEIHAMRRASTNAAKELNAECELGKLVELFHPLQ